MDLVVAVVAGGGVPFDRKLFELKKCVMRIRDWIQTGTHVFSSLHIGENENENKKTKDEKMVVGV